MKNRMLKMMALIAAVMTVIPACDKKEVVKNLVVSITSDEAFEEDNTAEVTLTMSDAVTRNVIVTLASSGAALPATTALPGANINFPSNVTIAAGSTSATFTATLDPSGLTAGTYSVGIQILSATGAAISQEANIAFIKATVSGYSGGGGGEGDSTPGEGSQSGWSVSYLGFIPFTYQDLYGDTVTEDSEVFEIKGTGSEYYYYALVESGFYAEYVQRGTQSSIGEIVAGWIEEDLEYYSQYSDGLTAADMIEQGEQRVGYDEFKNGDYEFFIFGTNANGNYNGKYAWCSFTKTGSSVTDDPGLDVTMTLQNNWTLTITGTELEYDDDGDSYLLANVTAPGSTYLYVDSYTDEELEEYADGDIANVAAYVQSQLLEGLEDGDSVSDYLYQAGDLYVPYNGPGETYFYILDFGANGMATGKYGKVKIDLPDLTFTPVLTGPLTFQAGWKASYGGLVSGYNRINVTGVTDSYFMFDLFDGEIAAADLEESLIEMVAYNINEYGYVYNGPSDYDDWSGLKTGTRYVYIAGLDDDNNLTGNYGYSVINITSSSAYSVLAKCHRHSTLPAKFKASRPSVRKAASHPKGIR